LNRRSARSAQPEAGLPHVVPEAAPTARLLRRRPRAGGEAADAAAGARAPAPRVRRAAPPLAQLPRAGRVAQRHLLQRPGHGRHPAPAGGQGAPAARGGQVPAERARVLPFLFGALREWMASVAAA